MAPLTIQLPPQQAQTEFNLARWTEVPADPDLLRFEGSVERNHYEHVIASPPPAPRHGSDESQISVLPDQLMRLGRVPTACRIPTTDGVRAAEAAWASANCIRALGDKPCFLTRPEICVEVLSPSQGGSETHGGIALCFDAGAQEVWGCSEPGAMRFFRKGYPAAMLSSQLCPDFPAQVKLRPI